MVELLADRDATDIVVFGGGIIPHTDIEALKEIGLAEIFTPGTLLADVVNWVNEHISER